MSSQPDFLETEARPWEDKFRAANDLLRARAWNADSLGTFRGARAYYAREYGEKLRAAYGGEVRLYIPAMFHVITLDNRHYVQMVSRACIRSDTSDTCAVATIDGSFYCLYTPRSPFMSGGQERITCRSWCSRTSFREVPCARRVAPPIFTVRGGADGVVAVRVLLFGRSTDPPSDRAAGP